MGPKGSGKRILFELITGCNVPTAGRVCCMGKNIHSVRYKERERLAIHYQQSDQVRDFRRTQPGFMLDFFYKLRREDRLVFVCVHPNERFHIDILKEICERYFFVQEGKVSEAKDFETLPHNESARRYLGKLAG